MDDVLTFLTSLDDNEVKNMLIFLKEYVKSRKQVEVACKLEKLESILRMQGTPEIQIEHSKICKMRSLGLIDKTEERRRITNLYSE